VDDYLSKKIRVLSLISIIAVVYIHAYNLADRYLLPWSPIIDPRGINSFTQYFIANGIGRFAVPLFFAISGYLYFRNLTPDATGFAEKFVRRLSTVGIPYLLWSVWGLVLTTFLLQIPVVRPAIDYWEIRDFPINHEWLLYRLFINPVPFQLWFLRDLLLYTFLAPLLYLAIRYVSFLALIPILVIWFLHYDLKIMESEGLLFFLFGAWLSQKEITPSRKIHAIIPVILWILWVTVLAFKTSYAYTGNPMAIPDVLIPLHKIAILCGFFAVWFGYDLIGDWLHSRETLLSVTSMTFFLYAAHEPILNLLSNSALAIMGISATIQMAVYLLLPLITIAFVLTCGGVLRALSPGVYAVLTGGRGGA